MAYNSQTREPAAPSVRLYFYQLSWNTNNETLRAACEPFGTVVSAIVIYEPRDPNSDRKPRSRGFGFVEMSTIEEAQKIIDELNETEIDGRKIYISFAHAPKQRDDRPFNRDRSDR